MYRIWNWIPWEKKSNYLLDTLQDVTILIKTLERPEQLINQLYSIRRYKFRGPIIVADDSKEHYRDRILALFPDLSITYLVLPFDAGTAEGRNRMLDYVTTEFFLLCDDDFIFEPRTRLPLMRQMLLNNHIDILGGVFRQYNLKSRVGRLMFKISNWFLNYNLLLPALTNYEYQACFEIKNSVLYFKKIQYQDPFTICDLIHNFFLARTDKVKDIGGWNPLLKGGEHQNFFVRAKLKGIKVATTRKCGVVHDRWSKAPELYKYLRDRGAEYQRIALDEFGIKKVENFSSVLNETFGGEK